MNLLGIDIGSSSVKASILNVKSGKCICSAFSPDEEMKINAPKQGWAEQDPESWWENTVVAVRKAINKTKIDTDSIKAVGISYQMHGLVVVDKKQKDNSQNCYR